MKDFTLKQCKYTILPKTRWHSLEAPHFLGGGGSHIILLDNILCHTEKLQIYM